MTSTLNTPSRDLAVDAAIALLAETWPACFSVYERRRRPLKPGIHRDILAALDGATTSQELRRALGLYTQTVGTCARRSPEPRASALTAAQLAPLLPKRRLPPSRGWRAIRGSAGRFRRFRHRHPYQDPSRHIYRHPHESVSPICARMRCAREAAAAVT
jgi:ProQ/FINO family